MKKRKTTHKATITGYVVPTDWDENDNVIEVSIQTDEDDFSVEQNRLGEELMEYLDQDVEVSGIVTENGDGTKWIKVTSYEVLSEDDYDDDDEYSMDEDDDLDFEDETPA